MPTSYTVDIGNGKITEFCAFALLCARAFGALITMREDPPNAPIPQSFEPDTWHKRHLDKAKKALAELESASQEELALRASKDYEETVRRYSVYNKEQRTTRKRYERMLNFVEAWTPPSPNHVDLKEFMIDQLRQSIWSEVVWKNPEKLTSGSAWAEQQIAKTKDEIEYHAQELQKEIDRTAERNQWIAQLRASFS